MTNERITVTSNELKVIIVIYSHKVVWSRV